MVTCMNLLVGATLALVWADVADAFTLPQQYHLPLSFTTPIGAAFGLAAPNTPHTSPCRRRGQSPSRLDMAPENNYSPFSGPKSKALSYRVTTVEKPADFLKFLAEDDRLCVVKVHAKWCVICKKFDAKWRNYVRVEGDKYDFEGNLSVRGRIRFAEIEFTVNEDLVRRLGAERMPHVLFYKGKGGLAGKLTQFQCGPSAFGLVIDSCNYFLGEYPADLPPPFDEMVAYQKAMADKAAEKEEAEKKLEEARKRGGGPRS